MTGALGADVAIEAVGMPATVQMATELVRAGGTVANVGVHGKSVELKLQDVGCHTATLICDSQLVISESRS